MYCYFFKILHIIKETFCKTHISVQFKKNAQIKVKSFNEVIMQNLKIITKSQKFRLRRMTTIY